MKVDFLHILNAAKNSFFVEIRVVDVILYETDTGTKMGGHTLRKKKGSDYIFIFKFYITALTLFHFLLPHLKFSMLSAEYMEWK